MAVRSSASQEHCHAGDLFRLVSVICLFTLLTGVSVLQGDQPVTELNYLT
jgi:hypothetical protein